MRANVDLMSPSSIVRLLAAFMHDPVLQPDQLMGLRNVADFNRRMHDVLARFLSAGIKIDGTVDVLLEVDEAGTVVNARPNTRNHYVDRVLTDTWKQARFHPYVEQG